MSQIYWKGKTDYYFDLRIPPDAKRLDLTFTLHRPKRAEFLVAPPARLP